MSQTLISTARMQLSYTIAGLQHKLNLYVKNATPSGGTYDIDVRPSVGGVITFDHAADGIADVLEELMPSGATLDSVALQLLTGSIWNSVYFANPSMTPSANTYVKAQQVTLVLRDTSFFKVKVITLEQTFPLPVHYSSYAALGGDTLNYVKEFTGNNTVTYPPFNWVVSRGERFLADGPFVGLTTDLNDKVRRARGLV